MINRIIRKLLPDQIIYDIERPFREKLQNGKLSFSQEGEDIILERYFYDRNSGFYVDIGSHHPVRFSNTYYFYLKGWNGINIDALPGNKQLFDVYRPRDINLELAISDVENTSTYYMFNEPALNTFCKEEAEYKSKLDNYRIVDSISLNTVKISSVLDKYIGNNNIDFMSVDVEGLEMNVLRSNSWDRYRPKIILVELLRHSFQDIWSSPLYLYLKSKGYEMVSKLHNSLFFMEKNS